jgi:hypothetical protein
VKYSCQKLSVFFFQCQRYVTEKCFGVRDLSGLKNWRYCQSEFNLIPKGTQALVRMAIKPGGDDDASKGWTGGYATASDETGADHA